ncbi:MAG TPA: hypothetical protein VH500_06300 [Nitrososphaeraceae archaeon]
MRLATDLGPTDDTNLGISSRNRHISKENPKQEEAIFMLCDSCYWSATFFGNLVLPERGKCPNCQNTELSSFPILPNESFVINHGGKRGIELKFTPRKKRSQYSN